MKLWAITRRGTKKDFIDIYFLLQQFSFPVLLEKFKIKFPQIEVFLVIRSLTYFADADEEKMPLMFIPTSWEAIKQHISTTIDSYINK